MELTPMQWVGAGIGFVIGLVLALVIVGMESFFLTPLAMLVLGGGLGAGGAYLGKMLEG